MEIILWTIFSFLCGSIPFAVILTRVFARKDIRDVGDGNPGATNVVRAAGLAPGILAFLLEFSKGAVPVGLAYQTFGIRGAGVFFIAMAAVLGHAFSPFLKGRGGKALAVTLGTWIGLTLWVVPLVILILLVGLSALLKEEGWVVLLTALGTMIFLVAFMPDPLFIAILSAQTTLIIWKHWDDLKKPPAFRPWLKRLAGRPPTE
jgi:glycerol-3-phosphate acyltransferase PlsY